MDLERRLSPRLARDCGQPDQDTRAARRSRPCCVRPLASACRRLSKRQDHRPAAYQLAWQWLRVAAALRHPRNGRRSMLSAAPALPPCCIQRLARGRSIEELPARSELRGRVGSPWLEPANRFEDASGKHSIETKRLVARASEGS